MRRLITGLILLLSFSVPAFAADTIAKAAIVIDISTGTVLLEKNADLKMPTASMSKVMTAVVVFDALKKGEIQLTDSFPVSEKAWKMQGSKMFVEVGKSVSVEDLIKGVIVQSGNDATVVLAEGLAGSEEAFAMRMNQKALEYGMHNSHFMNASGWPNPNHYSTPRDLALLSWHLVTDFSENYKYDSIREFTWNGITQPNRNPLLGKVEGADGIKTGHTEEAGYGLIGSAERKGRRVIMVISGLPSEKDREAEGIRLMNWALDSFKVMKLMEKGHPIVNAPVVYGMAKRVPLLLGADAISTVPSTFNARDVTLTARYMTPLVAPVKAGQQIGTVVVAVAGIGQKEYPLLAGADVARKGFIGLTFEKIIQAAN